jgi:hypothetical protein
MDQRNFIGNRKPQSIPLHGRTRNPVEAFQHTLMFCLRHAGAVIFHLQERIAPLAAANGDVPA